MTLMNALKWSTEQLKKSGIDSAPLDAEILLSSVLKKSREFILSHPEKNLKKEKLKNLKTLIKRRAQGEPIAYIVGEKEFYGLNFKVNRNVLIPRPETELIVDLVRPHLTSPSSKEEEVGRGGVILIDIGTGSGCIPISIAKNIKKTFPIFAADISKNALKIAKKNAKLNGVSKKITFLQGDLLNGFTKSYKIVGFRKSYSLIITANLPYIPTSGWQKLPPNIKNYEPRAALDGGKDGLKYYRQLFKQISALSAKTSVKSVIIEHDPRQKSKLKKIILKHFSQAKIVFHKDLAQKWRLAEIKI